MFRPTPLPSEPGARRPAGGRLGRVLWLAALMFFGLPAVATRFVPLTIEQLSERADAVVHGTVDAVEVRRDSEGRIFTTIDLRVIDVWRGDVRGPTCQVVAGGGVLGDVAVSAAGQVEYRIAEQVVVYLVRNDSGAWVTLGLSQGKFVVDTDKSSGDRRVRNLFWGGGGAVGTSGRAVFPMHRPITLRELRERSRTVSR